MEPATPEDVSVTAANGTAPDQPRRRSARRTTRILLAAAAATALTSMGLSASPTSTPGINHVTITTATEWSALLATYPVGTYEAVPATTPARPGTEKFELYLDRNHNRTYDTADGPYVVSVTVTAAGQDSINGTGVPVPTLTSAQKTNTINAITSMVRAWPTAMFDVTPTMITAVTRNGHRAAQASTVGLTAAEVNETMNAAFAANTHPNR